MRKTTWIRFGLGSLMTSGAVVALLATGCSSTPNPPTPGPSDAATDAPPVTTDGGKDAATPDGGPGHDAAADAPVNHDATPPVDSGFDAGPAAPWVTFVNASPDLGPVGLCVSANLGGSPTTPNVAPQAVLPPNAGGGLPLAYPGIDLTTLDLTILGVPYAGMLAAAGHGTLDGGAAGCADLTKADAGYGAITLGSIPKTSIPNGSSYLLAIVGCSVGNSDPACAKTVDGGLGVIMQAYQLDNTTAFDSGVGVQFLQLSEQWDHAAAASAAYASSVLDASISYGSTLGLVTFTAAKEVRRNVFVADAADDGALVDSGAAVDADVDATMTDAGTDATMTDSGVDATVDSGFDSGYDSGFDAGPQIPSDISIGMSKFGMGPTAIVNVNGLQTNINPDAGEMPGFAAVALQPGSAGPFPHPFEVQVGFSAPFVQYMSFGLIPDSGVTATPGGGFLTSGNWTFITLGDIQHPTINDGGTQNPFGPRVIALPNYAHQ